MKWVNLVLITFLGMTLPIERIKKIYKFKKIKEGHVLTSILKDQFT